MYPLLEPPGGYEVLVLLVLVILVVGPFIYWLVRLIEVCTTPESDWQRIGQSRVVYVLLAIFLGIIGTWIYAFGARKRLRG